MVSLITWLLSAAVTAQLAAAASVFDSFTAPSRLENRALALLKRQNLSVGSSGYNCHDNCGQAILEIQACTDVCNNTVFTTDYQNCLQCAGPDNANIWQWYGGDLEDTAAACGLSTTPLNGTQDSVVAAIPASNSTEACAAAQVSSDNSTAAANGTGTASSAASAPYMAGASIAAYGAFAVGGLIALGL